MVSVFNPRKSILITPASSITFPSYCVTSNGESLEMATGIEFVIGDTPEIIASKYYGDPEKHWIVLLANDIINPFFDFPLNYQEFEKI